jgi:hypothetical protein
MRKLSLGSARAISAVPATLFLFYASMAAADTQQTCVLRGGNQSCPAYVSVVPSEATDGSVVVQANVSTTLFSGKTPPNGFMVESPTLCWINDNGPAASNTGIIITGIAGSQLFTTPFGYKPIGPVSIFV